MAKKLVYRAGVIPYYLRKGQTLMLFMKPSDPKFGGGDSEGLKFQIAKGKYEEGENAEEAGLREAGEELGLFKGNILAKYNLGRFLGRTTFILAKIKDPNMFGDPHFETAAVKWMPPEEFLKVGRDLHIPVVKAAVRFIENREKENSEVVEHFWKNAIPLNEVLDYIPKDIQWKQVSQGLHGTFFIENHPCVVILEPRTIPVQNRIFKLINLAFAAVDNKGQLVYDLQSWKVSPFKVLGGVWKAYEQKKEEIEHDVLVLGVSNNYGNIVDRMRLYNFIARRYMKDFGTIHENVKTLNGVATILINTRITTADEREMIDREIQKRVELK